MNMSESPLLPIFAIIRPNFNTRSLKVVIFAPRMPPALVVIPVELSIKRSYLILSLLILLRIVFRP